MSLRLPGTIGREGCLEKRREESITVVRSKQNQNKKTKNTCDKMMNTASDKHIASMTRQDWRGNERQELEHFRHIYNFRHLGMCLSYILECDSIAEYCGNC